MKRSIYDPPEDLREPWQIAQAAACGCRGLDDMCPCQNEQSPEPSEGGEHDR
jgi:hypothetical protein